MNTAIRSSGAAVALFISRRLLAQEMVLSDGFDDRLACDPAPGGGTAVAAMPVLNATLFDQFHESWLASPAVADLDGDNTLEIVAARQDRVLGWHIDGTLVFSAETGVRQVQVYEVPGSSDECLLWPTGRGNLLRNGYLLPAGP